MDVEMSREEGMSRGEEKGMAHNPENISIEDLSALLQKSGIAGAGGAGFPTYAKLDKRADTIIMNCAECEPLLKLHRQLLEQNAYEITKTFHMLARCVGAKEAVIGIKKAYKRTIDALNGCIGEYPEMRLGLLDEIYPAGDEVVLIYEVTQKALPPGGLPIESGVAVFNVETVYNIYKAVYLGRPVEDKLVSIVGEVEHPVTVRLPLGCTIEEAVRQAGEITVKDPVFFVGGPMMGFAMFDLEVPTTKTTSAITCLAADAVSESPTTACINCGRCVEACDEGLIPARLARFSEKFDLEAFQKWHGMECVECGCCSYVCPARRPLAQMIKNVRRMVMANRKK